jgi:hypothetical protein
MLLGNHSVLTKNPGRAFGGSTVADVRSNWGKSGTVRGRFVSDRGYYSQLAATPNGHLQPSAWIITIKPGGMSSYTLIDGSGAIAAANLAGGKNAEANLTGSGTISAATGQLVVSAVAALSGSGTISSANALAVLQAAAALSGSGTVSAATATAPGSMAADLSGLGTLAATVRAVGHMSADITPFETLSPQALAASVWNSIANQFNTDGTMGNLVNIMKAVLANRVVTDPVAGTYTVYDDDDTTVLVSGDLWQDADGTIPYDGSGAERRDRLT